jgi:hypothetical protein
VRELVEQAAKLRQTARRFHAYAASQPHATERQEIWTRLAKDRDSLADLIGAMLQLHNNDRNDRACGTCCGAGNIPLAHPCPTLQAIARHVSFVTAP